MNSQEASRLVLEPTAASAAAVRGFVRGVLEDWGATAATDTAVLLASELATNAVLHARTQFAVLLTSDDDHIRVEVLDNSLVVPQRRSNTLTAATGRGVALVQSLATDWGATPADRLDGYAKGVWFTLPTTGVAETAWDGDWLEGL